MKRGFTIVELVLSIAILGVIAFAVAPGIKAAVDNYVLITTRRQGVTEARNAMERMIRELRLLPASAQLTNIAATYVVFQYPVGTTILYYSYAGGLYRNSDLLLSNITSLNFAYYDQSGVVTATPANVRSIEISLTTDLPYTLRTRVFMPNTGNEYQGFSQQ
ncbi:MAG: type II secretion system protein [Myxococcota bacterium]